MVSSGGIRHDFRGDQGLTPGEDRTLRWVVEDEDGVALSSFSGWTTVKLYWLDQGGRDANDGPTALAAAEELVVEKTASLSAPNADVAIAAADWTTYSIVRDLYEYELWRTDAGSVRRLAYGVIEVGS